MMAGASWSTRNRKFTLFIIIYVQIIFDLQNGRCSQATISGE